MERPRRKPLRKASSIRAFGWVSGFAALRRSRARPDAMRSGWIMAMTPGEPKRRIRAGAWKVHERVPGAAQSGRDLSLLEVVLEMRVFLGVFAVVGEVVR